MEKPATHLLPLWPEEQREALAAEERVHLAPYWFRWLRVRFGLAGREANRFHRRTPTRSLLGLYLGPLAVVATIAALVLFLRGTPVMPQIIPITAEEKATQLLSATELLLKKKDVDDALVNIELLRHMQPDNILVENYAGVALALRKDYIAAKQAFLEVLKRDPKNTATLYNLAEVEFALKNYEEAARLYGEVLPNTEQKGLTGYRLFTCLLLLNRTEEADRVFAKFPVPPSGRSPAWYYAKGTRAFLAGKDTEARAFIADARKHAPSGCALYDDVLERLGYMK